MHNFTKKHLLFFMVSVFFLSAISIFSCKNPTNFLNDKSEIAKIKSGLSRIQLPSSNYQSKLILEENHSFSPSIAFNSVKIFSKQKNTYTFVWFIDVEHTDFDELSNWKLGMILKPKNKREFQDDILEKKGIKTIGVLTKPYLIEDKVGIILQDFNFKPEKLQYVKFYLYSNTTRPNLNFWRKDNVSLILN